MRLPSAMATSQSQSAEASLDEELLIAAELLSMMQADSDAEQPLYVLDYCCADTVLSVCRTPSWCFDHWARSAGEHGFAQLVGMYMCAVMQIHTTAEFKLYFNRDTKFDLEVVLPARARMGALFEPSNMQANAEALRRLWWSLPTPRRYGA